MIHTADIVLDLGFGDSGKGKTVDWLCQKYDNPLIVRFSGGQQCGHTVINENGKHIHSSFPSGTLRGCGGYIDPHCTVSPFHMHNEWLILKDKSPNIQLHVHPLAHLTTPYEIALNRTKEFCRTKKHGSCGMGVGETMTRNLQTPHHLYVHDLSNEWILQQKLKQLEKSYIETKVFFNEDFSRFFNEIIEDFFESVKWFNENIKVSNLDLFKFKNVILEGSQGILLDMDHGIFPHVTYANTTAKNLKLAAENIKTYYVTRSYSTRHGAGPLLNETKDFKLNNTEEEINVENEWQGKFRLAPLNVDLLKYAFECDRIYNLSQPHLCITCLDQHDFIPKSFYQFSKHFHKIFESYSPKSDFERSY